jgi:hypothetical protein
VSAARSSSVKFTTYSFFIPFHGTCPRRDGKQNPPPQWNRGTRTRPRSCSKEVEIDDWHEHGKKIGLFTWACAALCVVSCGGNEGSASRGSAAGSESMSGSTSRSSGSGSVGTGTGSIVGAGAVGPNGSVSSGSISCVLAIAGCQSYLEGCACSAPCPTGGQCSVTAPKECACLALTRVRARGTLTSAIPRPDRRPTAATHLSVTAARIDHKVDRLLTMSTETIASSLEADRNPGVEPRTRHLRGSRPKAVHQVRARLVKKRCPSVVARRSIRHGSPSQSLV